MSVGTFVFDFDDTLVDTLSKRADTFCQVARHVLGFDLTLVEALTVIRSSSNAEGQMATLAGERGPVVDQLLAEYRDRYYHPDSEPPTLFAGIARALSHLRAMGIRLALVTSRHRIGVYNSNHGVTWELQRMGQADLFEVVVGYEDSANHKPDPDPFLVCMDRLEVHPDSAVAIGDNPFDIQGARAAGLKSAAALWGASDPDALLDALPDFVLSTPDDLESLVHTLSV